MNGTSIQDVHKFCNEVTWQLGRVRQYVVTNQLNHLWITNSLLKASYL